MPRAERSRWKGYSRSLGSFFGPLVTGYGVVWTRVEPKEFRSSNAVTRGFCGDYGTPLT